MRRRGGPPGSGSAANGSGKPDSADKPETITEEPEEKEFEKYVDVPKNIQLRLLSHQCQMKEKIQEM